MTRADDAARAPGHERDHQLAGMADDSLVATKKSLDAQLASRERNVRPRKPDPQRGSCRSRMPVDCLNECLTSRLDVRPPAGAGAHVEPVLARRPRYAKGLGRLAGGGIAAD
jgi:hypothetical protein